MKKLRWVILSLSVILCAALFINWDKIADFKQSEKAENLTGGETYVSGENYFESARYSRDQVRAETVAALTEVVNNEKSDETSRKNAENDISSYAKASETESKIESLVVAKGFSDCVAFVGTDNVSIVVEDPVDAENAAKIIDIAVSETGFSSSAVKIIELNSENNPVEKSGGENDSKKDENSVNNEEKD